MATAIAIEELTPKPHNNVCRSRNDNRNRNHCRCAEFDSGSPMRCVVAVLLPAASSEAQIKGTWIT